MEQEIEYVEFWGGLGLSSYYTHVPTRFNYYTHKYGTLVIQNYSFLIIPTFTPCHHRDQFPDPPRNHDIRIRYVIVEVSYERSSLHFGSGDDAARSEKLVIFVWPSITV